MTFTSLSFLVYFLPIVLILYYAFFFSRTVKNIILLLFSLLFYAWGEPKFVALLLLSIVVNYCIGLVLNLSLERKHAKKFWLVVGLIFNLSMLFVFKYLSFVTKNLNYATQGHIKILDIALPIGISFFTFQAISYLMDVYRKEAKAQKNILNFALYLSFFPKLTQGPITRYETFEPQILHRKETIQKFSSGVCMLLVGLGKKVLLANNMAIVADRIFEIHKMGQLTFTLAWIGAIAYTLQIYFDFSGYSDMAIGLGLMFGFKLDKNFNYPYVSKSISEFWRRWHISLGSWFREYLYFPLGGSRVKNKDIMIRNLAIVWISTGVWHGANWTFLVWGIINFVCIAFEKMFQFEKSSRIPAFVKHIYAMLIIVIGWVIFRSDSLTVAGNYIGDMFHIFGGKFYSDYTYMFLKEFGVFFVAAILFSFPFAAKINSYMTKGIMVRKQIDKKEPFQETSVYMQPAFLRLVSALYPVVLMILLVVCMTYIVKGSYNPFIYFQF